jgi:glycosyltransferase involved in cell wall biosynthesis
MENSMKVLHIHFGKEGGAERFLVNLAHSLHGRGVEQRMLIRPDRTWKEEIGRYGQVYEGIFRRYSPSRFLFAARLRLILRDFQPDVILAWQMRASRALPNYKKARRISRLGDYPHHLNYYRNAEILVCNTPDIARKVGELGWQRGLEVITNFTYSLPGPVVSREALQTPDDAFVVVGMGRFVRRKGFHTLVQAMAKVENAYLWLLGEGVERENLERQVDELGIRDRVRFAGWQTNVYSFLAAADVLAVPSTHEPLGNVCLEGWCAEKPIVSTRSEGPSWMMSDEKDGLLVDCEDFEALAAAIRRIRDDPALRQRLVEGGRQTMRERFSEEAVTDAYLRLFETGTSKP